MPCVQGLESGYICQQHKQEPLPSLTSTTPSRKMPSPTWLWETLCAASVLSAGVSRTCRPLCSHVDIPTDSLLQEGKELWYIFTWTASAICHALHSKQAVGISWYLLPMVVLLE